MTLQIGKVLIEKRINYRPHMHVKLIHISLLRWKLQVMCLSKGVFFKGVLSQRCVFQKVCFWKVCYYQKVCFGTHLSDQRCVFDKRCVHQTHLSITHQLHGVLINTPLWSHSKVCYRSTSFQRCVYEKVCSLTHHGVFSNTPWCVLIFTTHHGVF